jgi:peptide chain release factor 1
MFERLAEIEARYEELTALLADPEVLADHRRIEEISRERSGLESIVELYRSYSETRQALEDARALAADSDEDLRELGHDEEQRLEPKVDALEQELKVALLPKDPADERNVIVEIRSGAGGDEAGLFAADLFRMYQRYAERQGWKTEVLAADASDMGGLNEVTFLLKGDGVWTRMKHEGGPHRVQRVPVTESQGRIHTSAATVTVLPEAKEVDVQIDPNDLEIDVYRSTGPGGQSVNTTDSAVRITHRPSGIVVACQDEKSQLQNKDKAMRILRARLLQAEQQRQADELSSARRAQVGGGGRSEKIRTYNFKENRVTDHRVGLTIHKLDQVLAGDLDQLLDALVEADRAAQLAGASN